MIGVINLQLEPGKLQRDFVVDGVLVALHHRVHCLFIKQQQLVGIFGELATVSE